MKSDFARRTPSWGCFVYHQKTKTHRNRPVNDDATTSSSSSASASNFVLESGRYWRCAALKHSVAFTLFLVSALTFAVSLDTGTTSSRASHHYTQGQDHPRHLRSFFDTSNQSVSATLEPELDNIHRALEDTKCEPPGSWIDNVPAAALYIIITLLVLCSAFFSGLTLALMGLDTTGLEIVMSGDDPVLSSAARKIYPVRKNGNLLLCTLLLGNVAVNTLLGILMADLTSGTVGFISSTALIVIFGEIIPQATFSRYALQVGEKAIPIMKVIIIMFYVIAKPLAFCLDKLLGHELGTVYSKAEMMKLLEIHVQSGQLNTDEEKAMKGALNYQDMKVEEVMTPLEKTFVVNVEDKLNFATMATIFKTGYSRIPVYENNPSNIIGMLFVKDLIFINPVDETPVRSFVEIFGRGAHVVWADDKLGEVLAFLKTGHCHMALVRDVNNGDGTGDPVYEVKGVITLEDIIEVIIGDQIIDETDAWVDADHTQKVTGRDGFDWARLRLLDSKIVDETLSDDEVRAVAAHLSSNYSAIFGFLSEKQLRRMIAATPVLEMKEDVKEFNEYLPSTLMYEKDKPADKCTLILGGKVTVLAGSENFRSDLSSWSLLAPRALTGDLYVPDFSAYVSSGPCRCLEFTRDIFGAALAASELEALPQGLDGNEITKEMSISNPKVKSLSRQASNSSVQPMELHSESPLVVVEKRGKLLQKLLNEQSTHDLGTKSELSVQSTETGANEEELEAEEKDNAQDARIE